MKAIRIICTQHIANYKKEEADINKMTYPLPTFSMIIGALHKACGYTEYHPMDLSIQGDFNSKTRKVYRDHAYLNSLQNDRGILVKLSNANLLSTSFIKVASAKKSQGNDFEKEISIEVHDRACLSEYQSIVQEKRLFAVEKKEMYDDKIKALKNEINQAKKSVKEIDKSTDEYLQLEYKLSVLQEEKSQLEQEKEERKNRIEYAYAQFATLTTSIKSYEILQDINLILHVVADTETMDCIYQNIHNITSIGRSEDFVDILSCKFVTLSDVEDVENYSYSAYIKPDNVNECIILSGATGDGSENGTKYYMNKNYSIEANKRVFHKEWVLYVSKFSVEDSDGEETGVYIDEDKYVVNLI